MLSLQVLVSGRTKFAAREWLAARLWPIGNVGFLGLKSLEPRSIEAAVGGAFAKLTPAQKELDGHGKRCESHFSCDASRDRQNLAPLHADFDDSTCACLARVVRGIVQIGWQLKSCQFHSLRLRERTSETNSLYMGKIWLRLKLFYFLIRVAKNPYDAALALRLNPILIELGCVDQSLSQTRAPSGQIAPDRFLIAANKTSDLYELQKCAPGTLGSVYAEHMLSNGLSPEFFNNLKVVDEKTRFLLRMRQTHDLWHVLTGFSTSVEDELGLQAFLFAQTRYPLAPMLIGAAFLRIGMTNHPLSNVVFERVTLGWSRGLQASEMFGIDWEYNWNTPLETLRAKYSIRPVEPSTVDFNHSEEANQELGAR